VMPWNGAAAVRAQRGRRDPPSSAAPPPSELSAAVVGREVVSSIAAGRTGGEDVVPLEDEERTGRAVGFKFKCGCVGGGEDEGDEGIFEEGDDRRMCYGLLFFPEML
jgi:hypothetical protein